MAFWAKDPKGKNEEKINYLNWFCNFYCSMKLHPKQKETVLKPTQKGVLITVNSIIGMQETLLKDHDFNYFLTKFVLNDSIEQFHGDQRSIHKNPTPKQFKQNAKIISATDYMGGVKNGAYTVTDKRGFLTDFKSIEKFLEEEKKEDQLDIENLKELKVTPIGFFEESALAHITGYLLLHTILTKRSKCKDCVAAYVVNFENDNQEVNSIIAARDYKEGALTRPSELANKLFQRLENIFRSLSDSFANQKNLTDILTAAFKKDAKENFPDAPDCCFELMFCRFSKIRLHFEGDFLDEKMQSQQKDEIKNAEYGSKSSKAVKL